MDKLKKFVSDNLLDHQKIHVENMINIFRSKTLEYEDYKVKNNRVMLDTSETGTGKTYTSCAVAKLLKLSIFVVCPKSVIENWYEVASLFELDILGITTYETLKSSSVKNGYVNYFDMRDGFNTVSGKYDKYIFKTTGDQVKYKWNFIDTLIIFDEEQKSRNVKSLNSRLLEGAKNLVNKEKTCKLLLVSATPLEKTKQFGFLADVLGHNENLSYDDEDKIHQILYSSPIKRAVSMKFPEIKFKNKINAVLFKVKESEKIEKKHERIGIAKKGRNLGEIVRLRKEIEQLKIPGIYDSILEDLDNDKSVVIFVNFEVSMDVISNFLDENDIKHSLIFGKQSIDERVSNMKAFNRNKRKVLISIVQAGGTGISLHDTKGNHPRVVYIFPTESATILKQALGRTYRAGIKSDVEQNIVFAEGENNTVEVRMHNTLKEKLRYMDKITKGKFEDFLGTYDELKGIYKK